MKEELKNVDSMKLFDIFIIIFYILESASIIKKSRLLN